MPTTEPTTAVAVFGSREQARRAIDELRAAGFAADQIGLGTRAEEFDDGRPKGPPTWESGAALGTLTGASVGGLAAGPPGMIGGALVGLLAGALVDLGIPEQDARWYVDEAEAGRAVVTVRVNGRYAEAHDILLRNGGDEPGIPQV